MKKAILLAITFVIGAFLLSGCSFQGFVQGINIAKETTIYEETVERETYIYDEDENLNDDDPGDDEKDEDDSQDGEGGDDKDAGEKQEERRYE